LSEEAQAHFKVFKQEYLKTITPRFAHLTDEELKTMAQLLNKITLS
jgi:hypothetical protein